MEVASIDYEYSQPAHCTHLQPNIVLVQLGMLISNQVENCFAMNKVFDGKFNGFPRGIAEHLIN